MLEVARQRDIAATAEILLERQVDVGRLVRLQIDVAAGRGEHREQAGGRLADIGQVDRDVLRDALLVEARTDHRLRCADLDEAQRDQFDRHRRRRQEVGVFHRLLHRCDRHRAADDAGDLSGRALVRMHDLRADRALERLVADQPVERDLGIAGPHLFEHDIVAHQRGRPAIERGLQRVVVEIQRIERQHLRDAEIIERDVGPEQRFAGHVAAERRTARHGAAHAAARRAQEVGRVGAGLLALAIVAAGFPALDDAVRELAVEACAQRLQIVLEARPVEEAGLDDLLRAVVAPALRVGQLEDAGVGVIQRRREGVGAVAVLLDRDGVGRAALGEAGAGVGFQKEVGAVRMAPARIDVQVDGVGQLQIVVPAERVIVRLALVIVVALHAEDVAERRVGDETVAARHARNRRAADRTGAGQLPGEREFDAAQDLRFLEMRIQRVEGRMEAVGRLPLDRRDAAVALQLVRLDIGLGAVDQERIGCGAGAAIAPGVVALVLRRRLRRGYADRDAERVVGELVDIGRRRAIAVARAVRVELVDAVHLAARADRDDPVGLVERTQHPQVDRAGDSRGDQRGVGGLVDVDVLEEFRRILIELDAAIVTGRHLFAAVEQCGREIGAEAADRQALVATFEALCGDARQARERVRDRHVGQLADVFGRDRVDDQDRLALDLGGGFETGANAGHDDIVTAVVRRGCCGGVLRRGRHGVGRLRRGFGGGRDGIDLRGRGRIGVGNAGGDLCERGVARQDQRGGECGGADTEREAAMRGNAGRGARAARCKIAHEYPFGGNDPAHPQ